MSVLAVDAFTPSLCRRRWFHGSDTSMAWVGHTHQRAPRDSSRNAWVTVWMKGWDALGDALVGPGHHRGGRRSEQHPPAVLINYVAQDQFGKVSSGRSSR
jgi:hypothetical protein